MFVVLAPPPRIMSMIENSAQEAHSGALDRLTPEQSMLEVGLASTVTSVLQQCSKPIFMVGHWGGLVLAGRGCQG